MTPTTPTEKKFLRNIMIAVWSVSALLLVGTALVTQAIQGRLNPSILPDSTVLAAVAVPEIVDGKDTETGLIVADGYLTVKQNCTSCHSAKLITQNHLSRDRWEKSIRWMQQNQNLGDLGENEAVILDYLATHYGQQSTGRRKPLEAVVWYPLN